MRTIGLPEWHGMIENRTHLPPAGYRYRRIRTHDTAIKRWFPSPIKGGFFARPEFDCDLIESLIVPVVTDKPWIYSTATFTEPMAFSFRGVPLPRVLRRKMLESLFRQRNLKRIVLWSDAAYDTLTSYAKITDAAVISKSTVVHPGIELAPDRLVSPSRPFILFSGQFFRKGGMHVVDAFEKIQHEFPDALLRICSDPEQDFVLNDAMLRSRYLKKISNNPSIIIGRVERRVILEEILPLTSVYVLPSYEEAFGFAALEALAYGIPVVASNIFAIPEIITDSQTGILMPFKEHVNSREIVDGYGIKPLMPELHEKISDWTYVSIVKFLRSKVMQADYAAAAQNVARTKFSFSVFNEKMKSIYDNALEIA
jgi:glycosyltransferase involved in cell wall biosynthesis